MLPAGSTAACLRHSKDDDMTELTRNDLDRHDWAARASSGSGTGKEVAVRIEAIRSHQKG